jgi:DNA polymerase III alpha subunit
VWITHESERDTPHRLLLLCQSREGYLKLADWLTRAYRTNQHRGRPEMRREWFAEGTTGLIALSGFAGGDVGQALLQGDGAAAAHAARLGPVIRRTLLSRSAACWPHRRSRTVRGNVKLAAEPICWSCDASG